MLNAALSGRLGSPVKGMIWSDCLKGGLHGSDICRVIVEVARD